MFTDMSQQHVTVQWSVILPSIPEISASTLGSEGDNSELFCEFSLSLEENIGMEKSNKHGWLFRSLSIIQSRLPIRRYIPYAVDKSLLHKAKKTGTNTATLHASFAHTCRILVSGPCPGVYCFSGLF
jgi:hypothetical protein